MTVSESIIKLPTKEEFYDQSDSCYLQIQHIEPTGFRIILRNEALISKDYDVKGAEFVGAIARGLLELAYSNGEEIWRLGMRSVFQEMLEASNEGLTEEQSAVWQDIEATNGTIN